MSFRKVLSIFAIAAACMVPLAGCTPSDGPVGGGSSSSGDADGGVEGGAEGGEEGADDTNTTSN